MPVWYSKALTAAENASLALLDLGRLPRRVEMMKGDQAATRAARAYTRPRRWMGADNKGLRRRAGAWDTGE
ncbi:MAG TPA: hypothetical protein VJY33_11840, partial [Isosphaeraceae bacterium]|nr:hypothetical protein [Isosphaeraceae bacterium]